MTTAYCEHATASLGTLTLTATEEGLTGLYLEGHRHGPTDRSGWVRDEGLLAPVVAMVCAAVLVMRYTNPDAPRPFRVPLVPLIPVMGILACLLLMLSLPAANWVRLLAWMALGLAIYFAYSRRHSILGRQTSGPTT